MKLVFSSYFIFYLNGVDVNSTKWKLPFQLTKNNQNIIYNIKNPIFIGKKVKGIPGNPFHLKL